jgi:uncharacterized membrane protein YagU involved in acid resistance
VTSTARPSSARFEARHQRRGTRGFAAVVTALAGFVSLAVGLVALPASSLDRAAVNPLVILVVAFGILHLVAVVGLVRNRAWSARLVGYLASVGIGVAAYGLLVTITGLDPFGAMSSLPADRARAEGVGLLVWMIGLWLVAARFAIRGVPRPASTGIVIRRSQSATLVG